MKMLYEYSLMKSPIHRLDPRNKIIVTLCAVILSLVLTDVWALGALFLVLVLYGMVGKITPLDYYGLISLLVPFFIFITVIQIISFPGGSLLFNIGPLAVTSQGFFKGLQISLRALTLAVSFALLMMTTHPTDITAAVVKWGMPFRYAYMLGFALRFLPLFFEEFAKINEAQASRGLDINKYGIVSKVIALPSLLLPLTMSAFRKSGDIAIALEMRGLSTASKYGRTFLRKVEFRPADYIVCFFSVGLTIVMIIARVTGRI
ncbi:energy-coupling factor transporter transmembrane component T family protein [Moorella sulfitireducens]|uniref:energy-coupling factor transporter transmembrane component T family protein n=1 Tax=Neomoorella sulfitireducens TaxID=2972948 RepID=UPI0021AC6C21|nr:energy-coupling factor transporter transmembrane component T [Moorella sulfitireducens]